MAVADAPPLVVHLIPYDGIGGVEIAAATVASGAYPGLRLSKAFLADKGDERTDPDALTTGIRSENAPGAYWQMIRALLPLRPTMIVVSLWRSCLVGIVMKLLRPRTRLILFLHNSEDAHLLDRFVTRATAALSSGIFADSRSTAAQRLGSKRAPDIRVISFLTDRITPRSPETPSPGFLSWGRLHPRKRLSQAIRIFGHIRERHAGARYTIIGPDGGDERRLRAQSAMLGQDQAITFAGPATRAAIFERAREASFFLLTSTAEGMAMSLVEAMQLGLVPVTTPVGEAAHYVRGGSNGIVIRSPEQAQAEIERLLADPAAFATMRRRAIESWADKPLYRDDFLAACREALPPVK